MNRFSVKSKSEKILSILFWLSMLLAFNSPSLTVMTLLAGGIHEFGHVLAFYKSGAKALTIGSHPTGLRMQSKSYLSYKKQLNIAAAGPLANLCFALLLLPFSFINGKYFLTFSLVNLLSGISNLLPVRGYDGEKILFALVALRRDDTAAYRITSALSFLLTVLITFFSLYLIRAFDGGYWIFGVFLFSLIGHISRGCSEEK